MIRFVRVIMHVLCSKYITVQDIEIQPYMKKKPYQAPPYICIFIFSREKEFESRNIEDHRRLTQLFANLPETNT